MFRNCSGLVLLKIEESNWKNPGILAGNLHSFCQQSKPEHLEIFEKSKKEKKGDYFAIFTLFLNRK
jgi:hypothetical protein